MRILPINIYNNKTKAPTHKGNFRIVCDKNNNFLYRTTTYFFRSDLNWDNFFSLLDRKYKDVPKVNFINHCCSNGEETYSCIIGLLMHFRGLAKKFFPIAAKDINDENIVSAKSGAPMGILESDFYHIKNCIGDTVLNYFDYVAPQNKFYSIALKPKDNIKQFVDFAKGDILEDVEKMSGTNTVLLCRNFWPYLDSFKREDLAQKLEKKLDETSLVVIGDYDAKAANVDELLMQHNFVPTSVEYVFTKAPNT